MMMKYKTLASSHSCLRVILISSILVTTLQPLAWLALAQTLPSVLQNLPSSSATSEPSASSPRSHDFASTHPTRLASMLITGEPLHVSSAAHRMQTLSTTPAMHYQHRRQQQQQQQTPPKSLKFTLTAGKYWKFNIKTNSLQTSQKEKELRLHRNVSAGNYIIDDDGWFQYNHQQQQLFAWPGLNVKPATYYFVLLPSALDYEADGENVINVGDVVANIVVELIRPFVGGSGASSKLDVDQLIDYKLSLDNLHRHSSYPLLLTQIVSIFDLLSRATNSDQNSSIPPQSTQTIATTTTTHSTVTTSTPQSSVSTNFIAAAIQQNKQARLAGKFTEFLLVNSSAAQDGEFFSIAWTIQPTLINNTIVPITECRLSMINETVSRLSSRSILYPVVDDKFVISYALEGPLVNSQAIIPTERGNFALKLSLHNACRNKRVIDELGVTSVTGFPMDIDDKDNNVPVSTASLQSSSSTETPSTSVGSDVIVIPEQTDKQEAGRDREHAVEQPIQVATETHPAVLVTEITPASTPAIGSTESSLGPSSTSSSAGSSSQTFFSDPTPPAPTTTEASNTISASPTVHLSTNWPLPSESQQHPTPDPLLHIQTSIRRALGTSVLPPPTTSEREQQQQQQRSPSPQPPPKLQPQAKSFENFLDSSSDIIMNSTISLIDAMTGVHSAPNTSILVEPPTTTTTTTKTNSINASIPNSVPAISKSGQESSLNDDLIGILNEITELMVSIAVPLAVVLGIVLIVSILIAICNLCMKKRKSKQFEVSDRFKFRYGSERKGFLKKSSKPVILEADQKSLSMGGTPRHQPLVKPKNDGDKRKNAPYNKHTTNNNSSGSDFFAMSLLSSGGNPESGASGGHSGHCGTTDSGDCGGAGQ